MLRRLGGRRAEETTAELTEASAQLEEAPKTLQEGHRACKSLLIVPKLMPTGRLSTVPSVSQAGDQECAPPTPPPPNLHQHHTPPRPASTIPDADTLLNGVWPPLLWTYPATPEGTIGLEPSSLDTSRLASAAEPSPAVANPTLPLSPTCLSTSSEDLLQALQEQWPSSLHP